MNTTSLRTLFVSSIISSAMLLPAQQSMAGPLPTSFPNFNTQAPSWAAGQAPIAWGDCIPVPVNTMPFPQANMPNMNIGNPSQPRPMMPFPMPPMANQGNPVNILPPPSPFFNNNPSLAPLPIPPPAPEIACDDSSKNDLLALQARYKQAASASKNKIGEITQALNDANNQMADARVIINKLSKEKESDKTNDSTLVDLKKQFELLDKTNKELDSTNKSLQEKLSTAESNKSAQAKKLTALEQSSHELTALKSASKERNDETAALKKQLADLSNTHKTLQSQLATASNDAGAQARKLTALGQSATELAAVKSAYKERNDETAALKKQLADLSNTNKTLQSQLATASNDAGAQARKLTALGQSATELAAVKSAYKERNDETAALKKQLADLSNTNKTLQSQLATANNDAGSQARKLTALRQSATELTALRSAYKARNDEVVLLKKKLTGFDDTNKSLKTQLASAEAGAGAQARKLTALGQSATELTALKSAYKARNEEAAELKLKLKGSQEFANTCKFEVADLKKKAFESDNNSKTLLAKIATLESTTASQARKITALAATSLELDGLKSAYKDLSSKKVELTSKLSAATADTDKDGVLDSADKCPFSLAGVEVNAIGCLADSDNDGVTNSKDNCPESPASSQVNAEGCPKISDKDGDAVADASDLCPATPAGTTVNEFGCAPNESINLKGVNFTLGSARLTSNSLPILVAAAKTLRKNPSLKVEVAGYTDNQGAGYINKRLSQRRANAVMIELIKNGVDANNLTAKGYGEKSPIANNRTANGRATNRRVELKIQK